MMNTFSDRLSFFTKNPSCHDSLLYPKIPRHFLCHQPNLLPLLHHPPELRLKFIRNLPVQNRLAHGGFDNAHFPQQWKAKGLHNDFAGDGRLPEAKAIGIAPHVSDIPTIFWTLNGANVRRFRNFVFNKSLFTVPYHLIQK